MQWAPSSYSTARGQSRVLIDLQDRPAVMIRRGPALLDLTLVIRMDGEVSSVFRTHRSRALRRAMSIFGGGSVGGGRG